MVVNAVTKSCGLKRNRGARIVEGDEPRSLLLLYPQGQAAEYKQEVQHVVMPISTFESTTWLPRSIWVHKGELSNRDLAEPKREDDLPDVVFDN